ncbi:hypothetical protein DFH27DRAFT_63891 [Peziza echinospora]|nr:hypothetical protein DFH27DRAFT_63891 [Peziza echinospora]
MRKHIKLNLTNAVFSRPPSTGSTGRIFFCDIFKSISRFIHELIGAPKYTYHHHRSHLILRTVFLIIFAGHVGLCAITFTRLKGNVRALTGTYSVLGIVIFGFLTLVPCPVLHMRKGSRSMSSGCGSYWGWKEKKAVTGEFSERCCGNVGCKEGVWGAAAGARVGRDIDGEKHAQEELPGNNAHAINVGVNVSQDRESTSLQASRSEAEEEAGPPLAGHGPSRGQIHTMHHLKESITLHEINHIQASISASASASPPGKASHPSPPTILQPKKSRRRRADVALKEQCPNLEIREVRSGYAEVINAGPPPPEASVAESVRMIQVPEDERQLSVVGSSVYTGRGSLTTDNTGACSSRLGRIDWSDWVGDGGGNPFSERGG